MLKKILLIILVLFIYYRSHSQTFTIRESQKPIVKSDYFYHKKNNLISYSLSSHLRGMNELLYTRKISDLWAIETSVGLIYKNSRLFSLADFDFEDSFEVVDENKKMNLYISIAPKYYLLYEKDFEFLYISPKLSFYQLNDYDTEDSDWINMPERSLYYNGKKTNAYELAFLIGVDSNFYKSLYANFFIGAGYLHIDKTALDNYIFGVFHQSIGNAMFKGYLKFAFGVAF